MTDRSVISGNEPSDNAVNAVATHVKTRTDRVHRVHYYSGPDIAQAHTRFRRVQLGLLQGVLLAPAETGYVAGALIAFDGVIQIESLNPALSAIRTRYRWNTHCCIEWSAADGRIERRALSAVSAIAAAGVDAAWDVQVEISTLITALCLFDGAYAALSRDAVLLQLMADAATWYFDVVPPALFAHLNGDAPLAAVSRTTLARQISGKALASSMGREADPEVGVALNGYFRGQRDLDDRFIEALRRACRSAGRADHLERQCMLADVRGLLPLAEESGRWASLIAAWVIRLVSKGTRQTRRLAAATIEAYVGQTVGPLHNLLPNRTNEAVSDDDYVEIYRQVSNLVEASQIGKVQAALVSFHEFLHEYIDAPKLQTEIDTAAPMVPRANVLWHHEAATVLQWLESMPGSQRVADQVKVLLAIASAIPVRTKELASLRLYAIRTGEELIEVAIDPMMRDGPTKTPAGRRIAELDDPIGREIVRAWRSRRMSEGALANDLLFGDPHSPDQLCRWGETLHLLSACLKAVSGDRSVSLHTLRHSRISQSVIESVRHGKAQRSIDQLSASAGHESASTTFADYFHLYETWLRDSIDRHVESIRLREHHYCMFSGLKAGVLRKWRQRSDFDHATLGWKAIRDYEESIVLGDVTGGIELAEAVPPATRRENASSYGMVLSVLSDLARGRSTAMAAMRLGIPTERVERIVQLLSAFADRCRAPTNQADWDIGCSDPGEIFNALPCRPDYPRIGQQKYASLRRCLCTLPDPVDLRMASDAWLRCLVRRHLSLTHFDRAMPLLKLLRDGGMPSRHIIVCVAEGGIGHNALAKADIDRIRQAVALLFGDKPTFRSEQVRRGRPTVHLLVSGQAIGQQAAVSAGGSIGGLHALMLAAWIYSRLPGSGDADE